MGDVMKLEDLEPITHKLRKDLSGHQFNRLTVIKPVGRTKNGIFYLCKCACGNDKIVLGQCVRRGDTKSCGCLKAEKSRINAIKHGQSREDEYNIWTGIKHRCKGQKGKEHLYRNKHIRVCFRWRDYNNFLKDMGRRPGPEYTIERRNSNFNYTPWNCYWATYKEQARNISVNNNITYKGKTQCLSAWAEELGINYGTFRSRIYRGWSVEKAIETKV